MNSPFNEAKYKALLEGLEISVLKLKEVLEANVSKRFDSDFFKKIYINFLNSVSTLKPLKHYVKNGYRVVYENTNIIDSTKGKETNCPIFLQATDIDTPFINRGNLFYVDESDWLRYEKGRIKKGEILIEVKGKAEKVTIVPDDFFEKVLVSGSLYKLTVKDNINKYYLLTYLICKYGQTFKERFKTNLLISFINKNDLYDIPIPEFSSIFQSLIELLLKKSLQKLNESKKLYQKAETLLLSELGLENYTPSTKNTQETSLQNSFVASGRLDAEYYEPKYEELEERIKQKGCMAIKELCSNKIGRGVQPKFEEEGTVYAIASSGVRAEGVRIINGKWVSESFYNSKRVEKAQVFQNDVLLNGTGRGTLGRASIYTLSYKAIADNHVTIIRTNQYCDPYYLMVYLNSIAGQMQSEKWQCGSSGQLELYPFQIEQFLVFIPRNNDGTVNLDFQQSISTKIQKSFLLRQQSKQLLEMAKRAVEKAIEANEEEATRWIKEELERLGIEL